MCSRLAAYSIIYIALSMLSAAWGADSAGTRFGVMAVIETEYREGFPIERHLLLEGEDILPDLKWRESLLFIAVMPTVSSDLVIVEDTNGSQCPALYYIINVSASSIKATPQFGSCSDDILISWWGDHLRIEMRSTNGWGKDTYLYDAENHVLYFDSELVRVTEKLFWEGKVS